MGLPEDLKPSPPPWLPLPRGVMSLVFKLLPPPLKKKYLEGIKEMEKAFKEASEAWKL